MSDAAMLSAAMVLSTGMISAAIIARHGGHRGQFAERSAVVIANEVRDDVRAVLEATKQLARLEAAMTAARQDVEAVYRDNHAVLREILRREQECCAREVALTHLEHLENAS